MHSEIQAPQFESGSYGERSQAFFDASHTMEISLGNSESSSWMARTVTWARHPYRYWLEQSGVEVSGLFGRRHIQHKMFQVALMSAARTLDGRRELYRWYIVQPDEKPEKIAFLSNVVDAPEIENVTRTMADDMDFVLSNGLHTPNTRDMARLDSVLELGRLDGFEPLYNVQG